MKDSFSIRITYCESARPFAEQFIAFLEENVQGLNIQAARPGGNPKYKPGGSHYDPEQGEFLLAYSRLNVKQKKPVLPKIKRRQT